MRTLTMNEIEEVVGAVIPAIIGAVAVIAAAVIGSCSSEKGSGSSATAANGATVSCPKGKTATANATTASCR